MQHIAHNVDNGLVDAFALNFGKQIFKPRIVCLYLLGETYPSTFETHWVGIVCYCVKVSDVGFQTFREKHFTERPLSMNDEIQSIAKSSCKVIDYIHLGKS